MQLQTKSIDLSSLLRFLMAAWRHEREQPALSIILKYWSNTCNWGIFPKCAATVAVMSACPLIWGGGLFVCPEEAPVTQISLWEMPGDCGSSWCSQCCGAGCCQGGFRELSFPAACLIKGKFIRNSKYAGKLENVHCPFHKSSFLCLCLVHVSRGRLSFSRYCGVVGK